LDLGNHFVGVLESPVLTKRLVFKRYLEIDQRR
jgi:hypothetical protein